MYKNLKNDEINILVDCYLHVQKIQFSVKLTNLYSFLTHTH